MYLSKGIWKENVRKKERKRVISIARLHKILCTPKKKKEKEKWRSHDGFPLLLQSEARNLY